MEWLKLFYNDNQLLINIIGLVASVLTIIGFFLIKSNKSIKIDKSLNKNKNSKITIKQ